MQKEDIIKYWITSSDNDAKAMIHLFEKGDFAWALFIGHLVIEKLLKAWFVQHVDLAPPFIHDLVRLAEKSKMALTDDQKDILDTISTFNISARYDDYRMAFYNKCSESFTEKWITEIQELRKWLKEKLPK